MAENTTRSSQKYRGEDKIDETRNSETKRETQGQKWKIHTYIGRWKCTEPWKFINRVSSVGNSKLKIQDFLAIYLAFSDMDGRKTHNVAAMSLEQFFSLLDPIDEDELETDVEDNVSDDDKVVHIDYDPLSRESSVAPAVFESW